jgi:effector-binding domain-containing protein
MLSMTDNPILYKKLEPELVASIQAHIYSRAEIPALLARLRNCCQVIICGDAMVIFHGGAVKDGFLIEAAYPVSHPIENGEIHSRILEATPALTMLHYGDHQSMRETVLKVYDFLNTHAWTTSLFRREIYRVLDISEIERNVTEVQVILHEWDSLLAEGTQKELGVEARRMIMQGIGSITPSSSFDDYVAWIEGAVERLDSLMVDDEIKCRIVSHCAHVFPQERIDHLRSVYELGEFDDILQEMYSDNFWYEKPLRRGNVIYMRKNPFNLEGYANATTLAERRKAYCHCPFVHPYLEVIPAKLSPTFCYCGAGWYRRLWEGILGQPVKIEYRETLLRGNEQCVFTITLPLELSGECVPETVKV